MDSRPTQRVSPIKVYEDQDLKVVAELRHPPTPWCCGYCNYETAPGDRFGPVAAPAKPEPKVNIPPADAEVAAATGPESLPGPEADSQIETIPEGDDDLILSSQRQTGTGPEGQTGTGPEGQTGTGPEGQTGTGPEGQTGTGPEGQTGTGPEEQTGTGSEGQTGKGPEEQKGTGPEEQEETEIEGEEVAGPEIGSELVIGQEEEGIEIAGECPQDTSDP